MLRGTQNPEGIWKPKKQKNPEDTRLPLSSFLQTHKDGKWAWLSTRNSVNDSPKPCSWRCKAEIWHWPKTHQCLGAARGKEGNLWASTCHGGVEKQNINSSNSTSWSFCDNVDKNQHGSQVRWFMPVISAPGRLRQENHHEFQVSLGCRVKLSQQNKLVKGGKMVQLGNGLAVWKRLNI